MFATILIVLGILFLVGSIDDLLVDFSFAFNGIKPRVYNETRWKSWMAISEKPIAIMIPAWKEAAVLEDMVRTNLRRIQYKNYRFYVGVYPNDHETLEIAKDLEKRYPELMTVVVTDKPGPTSKAHCLNNILTVIEKQIVHAKVTGNGWIPHYLAIHDAEDVIHPLAFKMINGQPARSDFFQVPIFSLEVPLTSWVAGTYLDEFAEIHLKEMPVRQFLGLPIPSAGVGTFFSWRILSLIGARFGYWFDEKNLTEDYEISLRIARLGGKQKFLLAKDPKGEIIATREYFPDAFGRSVRQKTRWTTGIGFQTTAQWGAFKALRSPWKIKNIATLYALWRDRKALWANPTVLSAWGFMLVTLALLAIPSFGFSKELMRNELLQTLLAINLGLFMIRVVQRARFCAMLYGTGHGLLAIPRIALSNVINGLACLKAFSTYFNAFSKKQQNSITWSKTEHKFPKLET